MKELRVDLGANSYPIYIGETVLASAELFSNVIATSKVMIITNTTVKALYAEKLLDALKAFQVQIHVIEDGERYKK